jgi:histidine triad (HIT) family protein
MSDCIFCSIAAGTMPAETVYSDERTIAFLDIFPACEGHILVIPRAHADDVHTVEAADLASVARTAQLMAGRVAGALGSDGVTIMQSNGAAAGQTVFHYHVHVIPRFEGDGVLRPWTPGRAGADDLARVGALLRGDQAG